MGINLKKEQKIIEKIEEIEKDEENINEAKKIGVDYIEIVNKEKVDELLENIEKCFSFTPIVLIYSILSFIFFTGVSIFIYIKTDKYGFPITFFIFSIPIMIGIIILGVKHGIKRSVDGLKGIISFISQTMKEIEDKNRESKNKKEKVNFIVHDVILPIIRVAVSQKILGIVIYKLIEKIIGKFIKKREEYEKSESLNDEISKNKIIEKTKIITEKGANLVEKLLTGIYIFLTITGLLFCLTGIFIIIVLSVIRVYISF